MYSTRSFKRLAFLALAVLTVYLSPASLRAQSKPVFEGSFTLPFEARWGVAVLPPGQYTLTLDSFAVPSTVTVRWMTVRGENRTAMIRTLIHSDLRKPGARSYLVASRSGGKLWIRDLNVADAGRAGVVFRYALPTSEQRTAQVSELIQRIAIGPAGK